jgi:hypothetical protein
LKYLTTTGLKKHLLFLALISVGSELIARTTIRVTIIGDGEPVIGAVRIIAGTSEETIMDFNGTFSLTTLVSLPMKLKFSVIGKETILLNNEFRASPNFPKIGRTITARALYNF